jgi:hypothetical protein
MSDTHNGGDDQDRFEGPGSGVPDKSGGSEASSFQAPSGDDLGAEASDADAATVEAQVDPDIVALKDALAAKLASNASEASSAGEASVQEIGGSNIVGVGFGYPSGDPASESNYAAPGDLGLIVFTVEQVDQGALRSEIAEVAGTRSLSTVPIVQVPVGVVDAYPHRMRLRPAPGGISVGHFRITAGTLGCLTVGLSAPRNSRLMVLSNNHILADSNAGRLGDCICQPGPYDGGRCPADQIAILERFFPINFSGGTNYVDCATGWAWPDRVRRELMYLSGSTPVYFRVGAVPTAPSVGMLVGKTGRTTQLKSGRITAMNVAVNVNYGGGRIAHFVDQFAVVGTTSPGFSAGGDSGSLVWRWDSTRAPVGLLFAGGGGTTFCNRLTRVLSTLDVRLYT